MKKLKTGFTTVKIADVAELVDALVLGTSVQKTWGFESLHPHQISEIGRSHRSRTMLQGTL